MHIDEAKGHVTLVQEVVLEVLLDHVLPVPHADHEVVEAEVGVALHDVPQDGVPTDSDHGLGTQVTLLAGARADPPPE